MGTNQEVNNDFEPEVLDRDEQDLTRLVAGLRHVEAPANFERRVMAKIGDGPPVHRPLFAMRTLAYALPLVLVLLLGSFLFFKYRQPAALPEPPAIAVSDPQELIQQPAQPTVTSTQTGAPALVQTGSLPAETAPSTGIQRSTRVPAASNSNIGGGSVTFGQGQTKQPLPAGLNPQRSPMAANQSEVVSSSPIPVRDILNTLGMAVEYKDGWRVSEVTANSAAERSGVKTGDVVVALDEKELGAETNFSGSGSFSSIKVRRGGKVIPLKLK